MLGIDHKLYPHTTTRAAPSTRWARASTLLEADSTSQTAVEAVRASSTGPSGSSSSSTATTPTTTCSASSRRWPRCCPSGGLVLVADTLVEEFPEGHYEGRPWDRGDNPMTAVNAFLEAHDDFDPRRRVGPSRPGHRVPRRDPASSLSEGQTSGARGSTLERERQPFRPKTHMIARAVTTPTSGADVARHSGSPGSSSTSDEGRGGRHPGPGDAVPLAERPERGLLHDADEHAAARGSEHGEVGDAEGEVRAEEEATAASCPSSGERDDVGDPQRPR